MEGSATSHGSTSHDLLERCALDIAPPDVARAGAYRDPAYFGTDCEMLRSHEANMTLANDASPGSVVHRLHLFCPKSVVGLVYGIALAAGKVLSPERFTWGPPRLGQPDREI